MAPLGASYRRRLGEGAAAELAFGSLLANGKLGYAGAGSSGLMALADCLELLGTFGIPSQRTPMLFAGGADALLKMAGGVEDDPGLAAADFSRAGLRAGDVLIAVSASGTTPYTLAVCDLAAQAGVRVVGIANVPGAALLQVAEVPVLLDTGAEIVAGSTRLGAATAQKVALNLISVLEQPLYGTVEQPGAYWNFGDVPVVFRQAAPAIGQHTDEIMRELGFSDAEIASFREQKIIA